MSIFDKAVKYAKEHGEVHGKVGEVEFSGSACMSCKHLPNCAPPSGAPEGWDDAMYVLAGTVYCRRYEKGQE